VPSVGVGADAAKFDAEVNQRVHRPFGLGPEEIATI